MPASYETQEAVKKIVDAMMPFLNERLQRRLLGAASETLGHGGTAAVSRYTGAARNTITAGIKDLSETDR